MVEPFLSIPWSNVWVYSMVLASREKMAKIEQLLSWQGKDSTVGVHFLTLPRPMVQAYLLVLASRQKMPKIDQCWIVKIPQW